MKGKRHFNTGNKVVGNIYSKKNKLFIYSCGVRRCKGTKSARCYVQMKRSAGNRPSSATVVENYEHMLMCLICRSLFDDHDHQPKFLPCHHTFCKECLREYVRQMGDDIECPSCRKVATIPAAGVAALQTNFYAKYIQNLVCGSGKDELQVVFITHLFCSVTTYSWLVHLHSLKIFFQCRFTRVSTFRGRMGNNWIMLLVGWILFLSSTRRYQRLVQALSTVLLVT